MSESTSPVAENPDVAPAVVIASPTAAAALPADGAVRELFAQGKNGAAWFYWIAGLSVVNSIMVFADGGLTFALGLVVTMISDSIGATALKPGGNMSLLAIAMGFDAFVLGLFIVCGRLSQKRILPIYALGMVLYLLDGLLGLMLGIGFVGIAIHGYALWNMGSGFMAYRQLNVLQQRMLTMGAATAGGM